MKAKLLQPISTKKNNFYLIKISQLTFIIFLLKTLLLETS
ncbi:hypothetical protein MNBD_GAMMA08-1502 [hydrothermal vent metagenome]|uniref:Uncharacterized protein n=1 Tax=hydrothermal vent metagenome TaxID=652676 RepID=A0A3B0XRH1_9ZZZZ